MTRRALVGPWLLAVVTVATPSYAQGGPGSSGGGENPPPVELRQPPPADQPLIRRVPKPTGIALEGGMGVLGYIGGTGEAGPAWNVRITADFTRRFAAEANYLGAVNRRSDQTGTLTYTTLDADLRYNILRADEAPVQPFVTAGLGFAGWAGPGGNPAAIVFPVTIGIERMLTDRVKIGARFNLRIGAFDSLGYPGEVNPPGGDTWVLLANVGGVF